MNTDLATTRLGLTSGYARPDRFLLSVVVPCFNEQEVISATYQRLVAVLGNSDFDLQIVFVDDGSTDSTPRLAADFTTEDPRVTTVLLSRNFGHQAAVSAGLANADGDAIVVIDADLQDPPEVILDMVQQWLHGADVVYGIRTKRKEPLLKLTILLIGGIQLISTGVLGEYIGRIYTEAKGPPTYVIRDRIVHPDNRLSSRTARTGVLRSPPMARVTDDTA